MIRACSKGDIENSVRKLQELWDQGYSAVDIIVTIFRVVKTFDEYGLSCQIPFTPLPHLRQAAGIHKVGIYKGSDR